MTGDACPSPFLSFVIKIVYVLVSLEFPLESGTLHQQVLIRSPSSARGTSPEKYRNKAKHTQERAIALSAGASHSCHGDAELNRSVLFTQIYPGVDPFLVHSMSDEWNPRVQRPLPWPRHCSAPTVHQAESSCHCPCPQPPMYAPAATGQELRGGERREPSGWKITCKDLGT